jgi:hypothetical protein
MRSAHNYSEILTTEYDKELFNDEFMLHSHLAVISHIQWLDQDLSFSFEAKLQRFAIVWRAHKDIRVIPILEKALIGGIIAPVLCVSVRNNSLELFLGSESPLVHDVEFNIAWSNVAYCDDGEQWSVTISKLRRFSHDASVYDEEHQRFVSTVVYCCGLGLDSFTYRSAVNEIWISCCLKEFHDIGHEHKPTGL